MGTPCPADNGFVFITFYESHRIYMLVFLSLRRSDVASLRNQVKYYRKIFKARFQNKIISVQ